MRICNVYSHKNGQNILEEKSCHTDLLNIIELCPLRFKKGAPASIKKHFAENLTDNQWIDKIRIKHSRLTINFLKDKIGVCFQFGNVARTYADILKLNHLGNMKLIEVGVILVPHEVESRILGKNYANFDRLKNEIVLFENEIKTPLVIIGISN